ncbi:non-ribosomal peptide synthetase [Baaleninema simplex]|uniref:non-ribosomal peptide synthetase n=1 Tax=Baaleninema simplex TaxID=2862350 RepID=UPI000348E446|nr:non-ribosomal peptide synthetase [Baaleninema simplex]
MNLHSLLRSLSSRGIRLSKIENSLRIDAPKGALTPELRDLLTQHKSEILKRLETQDITAIDRELPSIVPDPQSRHDPFPLTDMQHAFWVGRSGILELGNVSNHGYYEIEGGDLDCDRLGRTLQQLIARHDMLRAVVLPDGQQQILETVPPYQLQVLDLRERTEDAVASELETLRQFMSHQVIPSDRWPLFDFRVTRLPQQRVRLHISFDLLVFDAWSLFRLFDEWFQLYQNPELTLPPLELSFRDYALAERELLKTPLFERSQNYWRDRLDKLPPAPDLPLAKNPKEIEKHHCRRYNASISPENWQRLKQNAATAGLTPSGALLAAFSEIIARWSKTPQFTINLALFNRLPMHEQVNDILGDFTSVTLLAVDRTSGNNFRDRASAVQTQLWQDLEHRYFSGVRVTRELSRRNGTPPTAMPVVFTSTLGFANAGQETRTFSHFGELVYGISQASQAWMDVQVSEDRDALLFNWDVVEELFPEGLVSAMFEAYCRLLDRLATSDEIWNASDLHLLPEAQLEQRNAVNATDAPIPDVVLQEWFAERVRQQPEAVAVIAPQRQLTYRDLFDRANCLGHRLRDLGATPNHPIAIVMEKGWEQIVAVMGILMAGAPYVPIDPGLPSERVEYLLDNSEAAIVLTQSRLREALPTLESRNCLCIDREPVDETLEPLSWVQTPDDLAYVIYTSGSTGLPKGVEITHRNVANMVQSTNLRFQVNPSDRAIALTALNHDLSVYDIFGLLSVGGAIVLPEAEFVKDPTHWMELIQQNGVTLWNSVPAMMEMLSNTLDDRPPVDLSSLRLAILGGDWWPVSLPDRIRSFAPNIQLLSIGGPTETTVWNIGYSIDRVDPNWTSIPYGKPMANAKYYVLNEALEDCPIWVPGQLYCSGVQLAKGYWKNPEKTAENFITHPRTGERIYRTGDRGRFLPDGNLEFLGRVDFQIKLRGYRIEAGEIESILTQYYSIKSAILQAIGTGQKAKLVAYLVVRDGEETPDVEVLTQWLSGKLPEYMIPSAFRFLEALPLSANGKVDRNALPKDEASFEKIEVSYVPPQNEIEQAIAAIFQEVLDLEKVGINDNFFDLGATSLLMTSVYRKLTGILPSESPSFSLVDLFKYPTVKQLSKQLGSPENTEVLTSQNQEVETKLNRGKNRLKQRFQKSRSA